MNAHGLTEQDLTGLIPIFYERVRTDQQLSPIFSAAVSDWPAHLDKLVDFWSSVMLGSGRYKGQPVLAHLRHADVMTTANFDRWLALWQDVTTEMLSAGKASALQATARRIAQSLRLAIQFRPDDASPSRGTPLPA
ncbi:group III truncated hemoglobin [Sphingomonas montana]|uniref:group III truncated hemoglobin n=1 Tax=Sphingomonas montana TaxID=1843236 RepID=UPI00096E9192|nr:group III truncated hemoglobin [Sphingomonas montana]